MYVPLQRWMKKEGDVEGGILYIGTYSRVEYLEGSCLAWKAKLNWLQGAAGALKDENARPEQVRLGDPWQLEYGVNPKFQVPLERKKG